MTAAVALADLAQWQAAGACETIRKRIQYPNGEVARLFTATRDDGSSFRVKIVDACKWHPELVWVTETSVTESA